MTNRDRVLKILRHEKVDRVPFMPLTTRTWFFSQLEYAKKYRPKWNEVGQYIPDVDFEVEMEEIEYRSKFYESIGVTFCQYGNQHCGNHLILNENPAAGIRIKKIRNTDNTKYKYIFETPVGKLEQDSELFPNATIATKKPLLQTLDDYNVYKYILENQIVFWPYLDSWAENVLKAIGDRGVIFATGPVPPIGVWLYTVLGVEGVIFGLCDHKNELEELIEIQHKINLKYLDIILKTSFKIIIADIENGVLRINPRMYDDYFLPYHKSYSKLIKLNKKLYVSHTSGEPVSPIISSIEQTGLDGLYGFKFPPSLGDPTIGEVCRRWIGKMTVMGGIDPHFLATSTPAKIKEWVKKVIFNVGDCSNFILGTADDTPFGTPVANIAAIPEALDELYG